MTEEQEWTKSGPRMSPLASKTIRTLNVVLSVAIISISFFYCTAWLLSFM